MVRREKAKISALVYVAVILLLCFVRVPPEEVGICRGCTVSARLLYPFFHAGFLHMAVNAWCLLSVVFIYDVPLRSIVGAYVIAVSFPAGLFACTVPTVGASGVVYALLGRLSFSVRRKLYWQAWWAFFIGIGFLFGGMNAWLHLYCYLLGVLVGFLNMPVR